MKETRITNSKTGGQKGSKQARYDLIPPRPLEFIARVYGKGCEKYAERNFEKGYAWGLSFASCQRHLWAFWQGEELDPESGLPHLAHAAWHCITLMQFCESHRDLDDRSGLNNTNRVNASYLPGIAPGTPIPCADPQHGVIPEEFSNAVKTFSYCLECPSVMNCERNGECDKNKEYDPFDGLDLDKPICYIAGGMRGYDLSNFPAFDAAEKNARENGWQPISPAVMDRALGFDETHGEFSDDALESAIQRDTYVISRLKPGKDCIMVLPGWEKSRGAVAEVMVARWRGIDMRCADTLNLFGYKWVKRRVDCSWAVKDALLDWWDGMREKDNECHE